jgi:dGTPase
MSPGLAQLRFPVRLARGRRYPEPPHPYRNEFQRDRDRIVHARAFRRLEDKTQVFTDPLSDHFRNRLTHTMEVAQIARTVAGVLGLDQDLTEALALAHDLGHPPFGHAGEEELNRRMERFGDRFDHNLHTLRIVERLEQRYARFPGLNLSFEVREGIAKHSRDFEPGEFPELDEYLPGLRPPLEAQLIDPADEIAYNTADLDDGFSAGLFDREEIRRAIPAYAGIAEQIEAQFPGAPERVLFHESLRLLIDRLVSSLIEGTLEAAREAGVGDVDQVRRHLRRLARLTSAAAAAGAGLKEFLRRRVYFTPELMAERARSAARVGQLFEWFLADPARLPEAYREQLAGEPPHRVVCDYIAGMTDGFFARVYRQSGIAGASDQWVSSAPRTP